MLAPTVGLFAGSVADRGEKLKMKINTKSQYLFVCYNYYDVKKAKRRLH